MKEPAKPLTPSQQRRKNELEKLYKGKRVAVSKQEGGGFRRVGEARQDPSKRTQRWGFMVTYPDEKEPATSRTWRTNRPRTPDGPGHRLGSGGVAATAQMRAAWRCRRGLEYGGAQSLYCHVGGDPGSNPAESQDLSQTVPSPKASRASKA